MAATTAVISDGVALRAMTVADLPAAHAMSVEMRWPHRALDWELALRHAEGLVAERDGQVVGTGLRWRWGPQQILLADSVWNEMAFGPTIVAMTDKENDVMAATTAVISDGVALRAMTVDRPARRPRDERRDALAAPRAGLGAGLAPRRRSCRRARRSGRWHRAALALGAAARDDRPGHRLARLPGPAHRPSADDGAAARAGRLQRAAAGHQRRPRPVRTPGLRAHRRDPPAPGRRPARAADRAEPRPPPAPGHRRRPTGAACTGCRRARHAPRRR